MPGTGWISPLKVNVRGIRFTTKKPEMGEGREGGGGGVEEEGYAGETLGVKSRASLPCYCRRFGRENTRGQFRNGHSREAGN